MEMVTPLVLAMSSSASDRPWRRAVLTLLLLLWRPAGTDWVEIPLHMKPPGVDSSTTTARPTVLGHSQLLSHLSSDTEVSQFRVPQLRRWRPDKLPINDLLDYELHWGPERRPGSEDRDLADDFRRMALVNVSSKIEEDGEQGEEQYVEVDEEDDDEPVQTQLLPFGNRYEEESIEASSSAFDDGYPAPNRKQQRPPTQEHFDDFDDYDERMSVQQQQQEQTDTSYLANRRRKPARVPSGSGGFGGFVEFLRRMQANFVLRTAHSIGDKIRTLADLRDQLLGSIERRIAALWVSPGSARRVKRGWMDPHAGADGMDFPSAEGALLTISFLTFAVFLIKLVLQVINTIKAKHYTYSTFAAATPVSGGVLVKRVRRHQPASSPVLPDALGQHYPAILSAINSYKFT